MGAWGTKLYQDDTTQDVRDYYRDKLKRGMTNEELTTKMLDEFADYINDEEDGPLFWFALAETQWKMGRLLAFVKEKALQHLNAGYDLQRWEEDKRDYESRKKVLNELKELLNSPMPSEKKVSQYKIFKCEWTKGDVFAYQLNSEYSKEKGLNGKYILIQKIGEDTYHPGHTEPLAYVYNWLGDELPDPKIVYELKGLPQFFNPSVYDRGAKYSHILFKIMLVSTSKRSIPKNLIFLGNVLPIPKLDKILENTNKSGKGIVINDVYHCHWKKFDKQIIDTFIKWENNDVYELLSI